MTFEIRVNNYMDVGSTSLEKYYKDKDKEEYAKSLNKYLQNMYFAKSY